jgi:hypothetical protein
MSNVKRADKCRVTAEGSDSAEERADKLGELTCFESGLLNPGLLTLKPIRGQSHPLFDLVMTTDAGFIFFVLVAGYSARRSKLDPESIPVLELELAAERVRAARQSPTPVVMFLFDTDRGRGRYLRLDTLPRPGDGARTVVLSFPIANAITPDSIRALADSLGKERPVPVAG